MGNLGCSGERFHVEDYSFTEAEIQKMRKVFDEMSNFKDKFPLFHNSLRLTLAL